jgi:hypothetical protein
MDGTIKVDFPDATDFNQASPAANARRGGVNAARLGAHTFFNAGPSYAARLERAKKLRERQHGGSVKDRAIMLAKEIASSPRETKTP